MAHSKKSPAKKTSASAKDQINVSRQKPANSKKILVVDNDQILVRVMEMKFKKEGFDVTVCKDGIEAIEAINAEVFHAIVLDLMMPAKNGFDVLQARKSSLNAKTPVFVLSAVSSPDAALKAESLGATKFFQKFHLPLKTIVDEIAEAVLEVS
jgi:CheY-like chemotaxis protein